MADNGVIDTTQGAHFENNALVDGDGTKLGLSEKDLNAYLEAHGGDEFGQLKDQVDKVLSAAIVNAGGGGDEEGSGGAGGAKGGGGNPTMRLAKALASVLNKMADKVAGDAEALSASNAAAMEGSGIGGAAAAGGATGGATGGAASGGGMVGGGSTTMGDTLMLTAEVSVLSQTGSSAANATKGMGDTGKDLARG